MPIQNYLDTFRYYKILKHAPNLVQCFQPFNHNQSNFYDHILYLILCAKLNDALCNFDSQGRIML